MRNGSHQSHQFVLTKTEILQLVNHCISRLVCLGAFGISKYNKSVNTKIRNIKTQTTPFETATDTNSEFYLTEHGSC